MIIVSDTSPLRYLVEVDAIQTLPRLYGHVLTTPQVIEELQLGHFPIRQVGQVLGALPSEVRPAAGRAKAGVTSAAAMN